MTNKITTYAIWIGDRSGSMFPLEQAHMDGYNNLIDEQINNDNLGEFYLSTIRFDDTAEYLHKMIPIKEVTKADNTTFQGRGSTALYDAIGLGLEYMLELYNEEQKNTRYVVFIMTDGYENRSTKYTKNTIHDLIEQCKQKDISVKYMGANQNAEKTGSVIGIEKEQCVTFRPTPLGLDRLLRSVSNSVTRCRSGVSSNFTEADKALILEEKLSF